MKNVSITKFIITLITNFRSIYVGSERVTFMLESLKKNALDKGLCTVILLTDLSKAFDCISRHLLIAKLRAYGFSKISLNLFNNYLCDRTQRTKIVMTYFYSLRILVWLIMQMIVPPMNLMVLVMKLF